MCYRDSLMADTRAKKVAIGLWGFFWGCGSALAVTMAPVADESIRSKILHGVLSWFYVAYHALTR